MQVSVDGNSVSIVPVLPEEQSSRKDILLVILSVLVSCYLVQRFTCFVVGTLKGRAAEQISPKKVKEAEVFLQKMSQVSEGDESSIQGFMDAEALPMVDYVQEESESWQVQESRLRYNAAVEIYRNGSRKISANQLGTLNRSLQYCIVAAYAREMLVPL